MENHKGNLAEDILVIELVEALNKEGEFLIKKMQEGVVKYFLDFDGGVNKNKIDKLTQHPLLCAFLGDNTIKLIKAHKNSDKRIKPTSL